MTTEARTVFGVDDIKDFADLTEEEAETWLGSNAKHIEEAMVTAGWNAIDTLLSQDGIMSQWGPPLL